MGLPFNLKAAAGLDRLLAAPQNQAGKQRQEHDAPQNKRASNIVKPLCSQLRLIQLGRPCCWPCCCLHNACCPVKQRCCLGAPNTPHCCSQLNRTTSAMQVLAEIASKISKQQHPHGCSTVLQCSQLSSSCCQYSAAAALPPHNRHQQPQQQLFAGLSVCRFANHPAPLHILLSAGLPTY